MAAAETIDRLTGRLATERRSLVPGRLVVDEQPVLSLQDGSSSTTGIAFHREDVADPRNSAALFTGWHQSASRVQQLADVRLLTYLPQEAGAYGEVTRLQEPGSYLDLLLDLVRRPYERLRVEDRVTRVGSSSRPSRRAAQHLMQGTRDWSGLTVSGVVPRRIQSRVVDDERAIYENRLADTLLERLIDELLVPEHVVLRQRIGALRAFDDYQDQISTAHWRIAHDQFDEWGRASHGTDLAELRERLRLLEKLMRDIDNMIRRLDLRDASGRRPAPVRDLHLTNLIRDDERYEALPEVWDLLARVPGSQKPTRDEQFQAAAEAHRGMAAFTMTLVMKAIATWDPSVMSTPPQLSQGDEWSGLLANRVPYRITLDRWHRVQIETLDSKMAFVPFLTPIESRGAQRELLSALKSDTDCPTVAVVVEDLGTTPGLVESAWDLIRTGQRVRADGPYAAVAAVSPISVRSADRIAVHVARLVTGAAWKALRGPIPLGPFVREADPFKGWLSNEGTVMPHTDVREQVEASLTLLYRRAQSLDYSKVVNASRQVEEAEPLLRERMLAAEVLRSCPVCDGTTRESPYDESRLQCAECGTVVRVNRCAQCAEAYLSIDSGVARPASRTNPWWVEGWAGRWLLAEPCWDSEDAYICSNCGGCRGDKLACARCVQLASVQTGKLPR